MPKTPRPATQIQRLAIEAMNALQDVTADSLKIARRKLIAIIGAAEDLDARTGRPDPRLRRGGRDYVARKGTKK
jgi:hypothetical protein